MREAYAHEAVLALPPGADDPGWIHLAEPVTRHRVPQLDSVTQLASYRRPA